MTARDEGWRTVVFLPPAIPDRSDTDDQEDQE